MVLGKSLRLLFVLCVLTAVKASPEDLASLLNRVNAFIFDCDGEGL